MGIKNLMTEKHAFKAYNALDVFETKVINQLFVSKFDMGSDPVN